MILAIDGLDGSGKSRLALAMASALTARGQAVTLVHVDDFRRPLNFDGLAAADESALYYDDYYDFAGLQAAVGARASAQPPAAITIVEGVMLLRADLPAQTWLIVLEVGLDEARRRIQERDIAKGRSLEEVSRRIDRRYFPAQARYRAAYDPVGRAHALIDNQDWRRPRLVRRAPEIPPLVADALGDVLAGRPRGDA